LPAVRSHVDIWDDRLLAVDALLGLHVGLEAAALFGRIGEFAEAIGQFDAAGIELEALGHARIARRDTGQCRLDHRIVMENRHPAIAEIGLDLFRKQAAEDVGPGIIRRDAQLRLARQAIAVGVSRRIHCREEVDAGIALEEGADLVEIAAHDTGDVGIVRCHVEGGVDQQAALVVGMLVLPLCIICAQQRYPTTNWIVYSLYKVAFLIPTVLYCRVYGIRLVRDILKPKNWRRCTVVASM